MLTKTFRAIIRRPCLFWLPLGLLLLISLTACGQPSPSYRHLASDVSLIEPGAPERDVRAILGPPDHKQAAPGGGETWIYFEGRQSFLRRAPYLGDKLGREDFQVVIVTIKEGRAQSAVYRFLTEAEFKALNLPSKGPAE